MRDDNRPNPPSGDLVTVNVTALSRTKQNPRDILPGGFFVRQKLIDYAELLRHAPFARR